MKRTARTVMVVEDSRVLAATLAKRIKSDTGLEVVVASSLLKAEDLLRQHLGDIFLLVVDLKLPDAGPKETVETLASHNIPTVVFTGTHDTQFREWVLEAGVVDYVVKRHIGSVDAVVSVVRRLHLNRSIEVLLVDDSPASRKQTRQHMERMLLTVHEAATGTEAITRLADRPAIRLMVTDYLMPGMDGCQLIQAVRERFSDRDLRIVGLSAKNTACALLLKTGADDFLHTPYSPEEFQCRVGKCLEDQETVARLHEAATQDYLTKLANRRHFFEVARPIFASAQRNHVSIAVGLMDLDQFKAINDTYGHEVGDEVLRAAAGVLLDNQRDTDLVGRLGGEEFGFVLVGKPHSDWFPFFERVRQAIASKAFLPAPKGVLSKGKNFSVTASFGVCTTLLDSLDRMLGRADKCLYEAKRNGRNQIVMDHHLK